MEPVWGVRGRQSLDVCKGNWIKKGKQKGRMCRGEISQDVGEIKTSSVMISL